MCPPDSRHNYRAMWQRMFPAIANCKRETISKSHTIYRLVATHVPCYCQLQEHAALQSDAISVQVWCFLLHRPSFEGISTGSSDLPGPETL
jgi:hypothetical protein